MLDCLESACWTSFLNRLYNWNLCDVSFCTLLAASCAWTISPGGGQNPRRGVGPDAPETPEPSCLSAASSRSWKDFIFSKVSFRTWSLLDLHWNRKTSINQNDLLIPIRSHVYNHLQNHSQHVGTALLAHGPTLAPCIRRTAKLRQKQVYLLNIIPAMKTDGWGRPSLPKKYMNKQQ